MVFCVHRGFKPIDIIAKIKIDIKFYPLIGVLIAFRQNTAGGDK